MSLFTAIKKTENSKNAGTPKEQYETRLKKIKRKFSLYLLFTHILSLALFSFNEPMESPASAKVFKKPGYSSLILTAQLLTPRSKDPQKPISIYSSNGTFLSHGVLNSQFKNENKVQVEVPTTKLPLFLKANQKEFFIYPKLEITQHLKRKIYEVSI